MSREININRQLLGLEDLLFGVGIVTQTRAGQSVDITRINASNLPFNETQTLLEWVQSLNLEVLGSMTTQLQTIYDNLTTIGNIEDNLTVINTLGTNILALQSLYTNISKLQNIDANMPKLQNIDANMPKLQNLDTNMSKLQAIYTDLAKLGNLYDNLSMLTNIYNSLTALTAINSQVIPNITELLLVNDNATQVATDKAEVTSMKIAIENIYDTFDDRFLGTKTIDPTTDNDGNILLDGALYFNTSSNTLKVYSLDSNTWYTITQLSLSGLIDVQLTSITTGDILTWNGTRWVNTRTPSFDSIKLNGGTGTNGTANWNNTDLTYDIVLNSDVTLQVGQEEVVYCRNSTTTLIPNGRPVMAVGTTGNSGSILVALHDGAKNNARRIIGLTTQDLGPSNGTSHSGFVTRNGKVRGLNTTGSLYGETWLDGDTLYVKSNGGLTKFEPVYTELKMPIAFVIHAHTNGTLYVRTTGIDENHDRDLIANKIDKSVVDYSNANDVAGYPHFIRFTPSTLNSPQIGNYFEGYTTTNSGYQVMTVSLVGGGGPTQYPRTWTRANRASGWTPWAEVLTDANGTKFVNVLNYGADPTGTLDSSTAFNNALNYNKSVYVPKGTYLIQNKVVVNSGNRLYGDFRRLEMNAMNSGNYPLIKTDVSNVHNGSFELGIGGAIEGMVFRQLQVAEGSIPSTWLPAGKTCNALYYGGNGGIFVRDCAFLGYWNMLYSTGNMGQSIIENIELDCYNAITSTGTDADTIYLSNIHKWVFMGKGIAGTLQPGAGDAGINNTTYARGTLFDFRYADWLQITNCFSHSTKSYLKSTDQLGQASITGGGYDYEVYYGHTTNEVAINLLGATGDAGNISITGTSFNGGHEQIRVELTSISPIDTMVIVDGCKFNRPSEACIDVQRGIVNVSNSVFKTSNTGNATKRIGLVGNNANNRVIMSGNVYGPTVIQDGVGQYLRWNKGTSATIHASNNINL